MLHRNLLEPFCAEKPAPLGTPDFCGRSKPKPICWKSRASSSSSRSNFPPLKSRDNPSRCSWYHGYFHQGGNLHTIGLPTEMIITLSLLGWMLGAPMNGNLLFEFSDGPICVSVNHSKLGQPLSTVPPPAATVRNAFPSAWSDFQLWWRARCCSTSGWVRELHKHP